MLRGGEGGVEEVGSLRFPVPGRLGPDVLQALPPAWRSSVSTTEEEVTPEHRLW